MSKKLSGVEGGSPSNRELADIVRLLTKTMDLRQVDHAKRAFVDLLGKGVARNVFPLLFYGLANVLERDGVTVIAVAFEKIAEISKVDARARESTDYWNGGESVRQAFLKFHRQATKLPSKPGDLLPSMTVGTIHAQLFLERSARSEPSLNVGVLFTRVSRSGSEKGSIEPTDTLHNFTRPPISDFFMNDVGRQQSYLESRSVTEGVSSLRNLLFHEPVLLIAGVTYEFDNLPANIRMIDWGDGDAKAPWKGRVMRHTYREPGTYSITVWLEGKKNEHHENAVKVVTLRSRESRARSRKR